MTTEIGVALDHAVKETLRSEVEIRIKKIIDDSKAQVEAEIRKAVAISAMNISRMYSMQMLEDVIRIEVKVDSK